MSSWALFCVLRCWLIGLAAASFAGQAVAASTWVKVESGHFTVLSQGSEAETKRWAAELAQFQRGLQIILPVANERLRPVTVLLFKSDREFRPFKPREKGKPQKIAGLFSKTQDCQVIALSLDHDADDLRRVAYHEAVHWHISAAEASLPPWLEEGLAEVYSTFKATDDGGYTFGSTMEFHLRYLSMTKAMPLEQLTAVTRGSLSYNDGNRATLFYAQSWAFVHYLLFGEGTPGMASVTKYVEVSEHSASLAAAFTRAFGGDYRTLDERLAAYLRGGSYHRHTYRYKEVPAAAAWRISPAQPGEVSLALGILLLGIAERREEALVYLHQAASLMADQPVVWQALGEAALLANNQTEAFEHFTRAVDRGSMSYFVHFGLGVTRLQGQTGGGSVPGSGEAGYAARNFRRAIELNPHFVAAYESLGGVLPAVENPEVTDRMMLERGRRLTNNRGSIDLGLAVCELKAGERAQGRGRLESLLTDHTIKAEVQMLARTLLKDDEWRVFSEQMEGFFKAKKYREIVAAIDANQDAFAEARYAPTLALNRDLAEHYHLLMEAVGQLNRGEFAAARSTLERLREHRDLNVRAEARRLLEALEKGSRRR